MVLEQSQCDKKLMDEIVLTLGKDAYDALSPEDRQTLDLFIWAGCCMHKNENSFKGGNNEMKLEWAKLGVAPPVILANKSNTATLCNLLDPTQPNSLESLTEDEQQAFEQSTCGGVKTTALAGAILNYKDDKKGQGDKHIHYFKEKVDAKYKQFPDTSNTRFGSHGDAVADLIQYLEPHIDYPNIVRLSKGTTSLTNIEHNVLKALKDVTTLTKLCVMVLYHQAVCKPYMNAVRGLESDNVLDLGPLHGLVCEFVGKVVENPDLVVSEDLSCVKGTLDGKPWDNSSTIMAVLKLMPTLPHIKEITVVNQSIR